MSWATGYGNTTQSPVDPNFFTEESGPSSTAYWGTSPGQYSHNFTANAATITRYNQVSKSLLQPAQCIGTVLFKSGIMFQPVFYTQDLCLSLFVLLHTITWSY